MAYSAACYTYGSNWWDGRFSQNTESEIRTADRSLHPLCCFRQHRSSITNVWMDLAQEFLICPDADSETIATSSCTKVRLASADPDSVDVSDMGKLLGCMLLVLALGYGLSWLFLWYRESDPSKYGTLFLAAAGSLFTLPVGISLSIYTRLPEAACE